MTKIIYGTNANGNRFGRAPGLWAWRILVARQGPPDGAMRSCLWALSTFLDEDGEGWATQKQIAEAAALSERTVREKLAGASVAGWLGMKPKGESGRLWKVYEFRACIPDELAIHARSDSDAFPDKVDELIDAVEARCGPVTSEWLQGSHFHSRPAADSGHRRKRPERASGHKPTNSVDSSERPANGAHETGTSCRLDRQMTAERPAGGSDTVTNTVPPTVTQGLVRSCDRTATDSEEIEVGGLSNSQLQVEQHVAALASKSAVTAPKANREEYRRRVVELGRIGKFSSKEIATAVAMPIPEVEEILRGGQP